LSYQQQILEEYFLLLTRCVDNSYYLINHFYVIQICRSCDCLAIRSRFMLCTLRDARDGPKFDECRTLGRMFGRNRNRNRIIWPKYSAESFSRTKFGGI